MTAPSGGHSQPGIKRHANRNLKATARDGIPVTTPARTLIDLSWSWSETELEAAVNEADKLGLVNAKSLLRAATAAGRRGARLRRLLERLTFRATDSELERQFLRLVRRGGLPMPETRKRVNGYRVDFYWPELGLVVEADGGRFHRTPSQQRRDRVRDQAHTAAGLTPLRFTHGQVFFEEKSTLATLAAVVRRLTAAAERRPS